MLFFSFLDLLVIVEEPSEVSIVVVDNLNLIGSLVKWIDVGSQFHLKGFCADSLLPEIFNCDNVTRRIDYFVTFFHFLKGGVVEGPPMQPKDEEDQQFVFAFTRLIYLNKF